MFRILHTNFYTWLLLLGGLLLVSCQKSESPEIVPSDNPAVVQTWRYPCGPACNAAAWVLVMQDGMAYEALDLPPDFQKEEQPVLVQFRKTGHKNALLAGTGLEIISILKIRPR